MNDDRDKFRPGPCPVCAKPEGGYMSNTAWGHDVLCCGSTCGMKMGERLSEVHRSREYRAAAKAVADATIALEKIQAEAVASFQPSI